MHFFFFFFFLSILNVAIKFSLSADHLTYFGCYTCLTAEAVMIREEEKV